MKFAEIGPQYIDTEEYHADIDLDYDWNIQNNQFTNQQIETMSDNWLLKQKETTDLLIESISPTIHRHQLNKMQKFAFDLVNVFENQKKQLCMIINGGAGSGKTFLINSLCYYLKNSVLKAAPTAKAAQLIQGETIHALFGINTNDMGRCLELGSNQLRKIQEIFKGIKTIIIDEYSMLSQTMLGRIDLRLRQITGKTDQYFGGLSIILTGELLLN
jgi:predicted ATPase